MADADVLKISILRKDSIHCGFHLVPYIARTVLTTLPSSTYVLVTDTNIARLHLSAFQAEFEAALAENRSASRFLTHVVAPGETTKSREGKADVEDFLLSNKCTRDTVILALGGGVIGDLVGFVAATFMRGARFVQIPTTLLAMVDSSVGGKTAIDTPHGKNLIGAFWQPEYIFIDAAFLQTLPAREFSNGMAEVVKTAAIWDEAEFATLEAGAAEIRAAVHAPAPSPAGRTLSTRSASQHKLLSVIAGSVRVKAHIVTVDERETGLRNLVNFGHTIGHAIEAVLAPAALHGECVSVGMILEAEVARQLGALGQVAIGRLSRALTSYDLPVTLSDPRLARIPAAKGLGVERLLDIMKIDKKNSGPEKRIVLLSRIGKTLEERASAVPDPVIAKTLSLAVKVVPGVPSKAPIRMATPGSKSISNRALVLAALGSGTCRLTNLLHSDDTQVMMAALQDLQGASFSWEDNGETLVVQGGGGSLSVPPKDKEIYLGNAGTAARFLTAVCTLAQPSSSSSGAPHTVVTGNARMKQRPIGPLVDALRANGSSLAYVEREGCLPLHIAPGGLAGGRIQLAASVSSQYVSAVLLCAPYAREPVTLELVGGQVISQPYIDMTLAMMRTFGVHVERVKDAETGKLLDVYRIPQATYKNPEAYAIESDASSATYPLAIAAITGTECTIENIGSGSLQGDARFAREVLEPMGCEVVQTEMETTVRGPPPGTLRALGEVDMEPMTDAFLTASVLAAVATAPPKEGRVLNKDSPKTTSRIFGIANQRVKECNRIKAMIDELAKFGVETKEFDDGLEVYGRPAQELGEGVSVHCYDDHRVAMAFSVLGTVIKETVLEEKRCVEKTWPNWWDDLENKIGLHVEGVDLAASHAASASAANGAAVQATERSASIILIGMRGSGKTFIGDLASQALGWPVVDADAYFETYHQLGVRAFVTERGWPAFRQAETELLNHLLDKYPTGHVLSLGGGIVETPSARDFLVKYKSKGPVVWIVRDVDEVVHYLGEETARPAYGEPVTDVFRRREPWFAECSSHEFVNHTGALTSASSVQGEAAALASRTEVERFFRHITGQRTNYAPNQRLGARSYFLSLTYPDLIPALPHIEELTAGVDAIELRVDLLRRPQDIGTDVGSAKGYIPPRAYIADQLAALRLRTSLPIVFTVRTAGQGGSFPGGAEKEAFELYELALRLGVEYIDLELGFTEQRVRAFAKACKGRARVLASWHDWSGNMKWNGREVDEKYALASEIGDIVKIVGRANSLADNFALRAFVERKTSATDAKPILAINMGTEGQLSRVLNETFSPVTSALLPNAAAPGQLTFAQVQQALHLLGQLPARKFFLLGSPIAHSPSPALHNTGFHALGLPHSYGLLESEDAGGDPRVRAALRAPDFGGASVTIPCKCDVMPLLDELSEHARAIGAVNTIIPVGNGQLRGDNTDWLGIRACVRARLPAGKGVPSAGLVIGAGGTARAAIYALHQLGMRAIYLYNRTRSSAEALRDAFPDLGVTVLEAPGTWPAASGAPGVIISTVPAAAVGTGVALVPATFERVEGGVAVDMAYKPAETEFLKMASAASGWATVRGVEVLLEQGYEQFEAWTGRRCPRELVKRKVMEVYSA